VRNRTALLFALGALAIIGLWWFFVYSPAGDELDDVRAEREAAEQQTAGLQAQRDQLRDIEERGPEIDAQLMALEGLVPATPDLASFILSANEIALQSGIDWLSITPSEPQADAATGLGTINMQIAIEGGFFQTLDYLNRLEDLQRLVVVDSVSLSGASDAAAGGAPSLSTSLVARMFTQAVPEVPGVPTVPGTPTEPGQPAPGEPSVTTTAPVETTAPAGEVNQ
jgi:Tfp pilus assembly protein PilO